MNTTPPPLLDVRNLRISFRDGDRTTTAVDGISFRLQHGETLAIVGESGSGKSVTALSLTRLLPEPPANIESGQIFFNGTDLLALPPEKIRAYRGKKVAYIFQEPGSSLNPVFRIRTQIAEALRLHRPEVLDEEAECGRLLDLVGIRQPRTRLNDYPHQLSGGMQQRVMIAMALACQPSLLVADEPTTALDVTIQKQVMDLLKDLKKNLGMSFILITHNFGIVSGFADQIAVMYRGRIVEQGAAPQVLASPQHPYTRALMDCIPKLGRRQKRLTTIDHDNLTNTELAHP